MQSHYSIYALVGRQCVGGCDTIDKTFLLECILQQRTITMTAMETLVATKPPIARDTEGVFRVGETRVRLETVLTAFQQGSTPEAIAYKYPVLNLADIYAVITYYLQYQDEVEAYLVERREQIDETERDIRARFPTAGLRERLLARRQVSA